MVQLILLDVYGQEFVAPHPGEAAPGDDVRVPDLVLGLEKAGRTAATSTAGVMPGYIAVQNGSQDGGLPGTSTNSNPYMNHIGVVINSPIDGSIKILSNSSNAGAFSYMDSLQFSNIGFPSRMMGQTLFLKPSGP